MFCDDLNDVNDDTKKVGFCSSYKTNIIKHLFVIIEVTYPLFS